MVCGKQFSDICQCLGTPALLGRKTWSSEHSETFLLRPWCRVLSSFCFEEMKDTVLSPKWSMGLLGKKRWKMTNSRWRFSLATESLVLTDRAMEVQKMC